MYRRLPRIFIPFLLLCFFPGPGAQSETEFQIGEKIKYGIYFGGIHMASQTMEIVSKERLNQSDVYKIVGRTKSSLLMSLFYRLDDKWIVYLDRDTLLPVRVEKDMREGKQSGYFIYDIDQDKRRVAILYPQEDKAKKVIPFSKDLFDIISLAYFMRAALPSYDVRGDTFSVDFLEPTKVKTVAFRNQGIEKIALPRSSHKGRFETHHFKQIGSYEIEFFIDCDEEHLPLKLFVSSRFLVIDLNIEAILLEYSNPRL